MTPWLRRTPTRSDLRQARRVRPWNKDSHRSLLLGFPILFVVVTLVLHHITGGPSGNEPACLDAEAVRRLSLDALVVLEDLEQQKAVLQASTRSLLRAPDPVFLFIGVFSTPESSSARQLLRESWIRQATDLPGVMVRFVIDSTNASEPTVERVRAEAAQHKDIVTIGGGDQGSSRTYALMAHAVYMQNATFIMKAEDRTWIDAASMLAELMALCRTPMCRNERLYLGHESRSPPSYSSPGGASSPTVDSAYRNHTSLSAYMPYMLGGGYVLSQDLARLVLEVNTLGREQHGEGTSSSSYSGGLLKFLPDDDIAIGVWLLSVDLRRINHPRFLECDAKAMAECLEGAVAAASNSTKDDFLARYCAVKPIVIHPAAGVGDSQLLSGLASNCEQASKLHACAAHLALRHARVQRVGSLDASAARVAHVSPSEGAWQMSLGSSGSRPWSLDGKSLLALRLPKGGSQLTLGMLRHDTASDQTWSWQPLDSLHGSFPSRELLIGWRGASADHIVFTDSCEEQQHMTSPNEAQPAPGPISSRSVTEHKESVHAPAPSGTAMCTILFSVHQLGRTASMPGRAIALSRCGRWALQLGTEGASLWLADLATRQRHHLIGVQDLGISSGILVTNCQVTNRSGSSLIRSAEFAPDASSVAFVLQPCAGAKSISIVVPLDDPTLAKGRLPQLLELPKLPNGQQPAAVSYMTRDILLVCSASGAWQVRLGMGLGLSPSASSWHVPSTPVALETIGRSLAPGEEIVGCTTSSAFGSTHHVLLDLKILGEKDSARRLIMVDTSAQLPTHTKGRYTAAIQSGGRDLVPASLPMYWDPDGRAVAFASAHAGAGQQIYVARLPNVDGEKLGMTNRAGRGARPSLVYQQEREVVVDVGTGDGRRLVSWLHRQPQTAAGPPNWAVHAWEASPIHLPKLERALAAAKRSGWDLMLHPQAAWVHDGMVVLNQRDEGSRRDEDLPKPGWLSQLVSTFVLSWSWAKKHPPISMFAPETDNAPETMVPAADFGAWLARLVSIQANRVHLHLDAAGAEFELLEQLLGDGTLAQIESVHVVWNSNLRPELTHLPAVWRQVFQVFGVRWGKDAASLSSHDHHSKCQRAGSQWGAEGPHSDDVPLFFSSHPK